MLVVDVVLVVDAVLVVALGVVFFAVALIFASLVGVLVSEDAVSLAKAVSFVDAAILGVLLGRPAFACFSFFFVAGFSPFGVAWGACFISGTCFVVIVTVCCLPFICAMDGIFDEGSSCGCVGDAIVLHVWVCYVLIHDWDSCARGSGLGFV